MQSLKGILHNHYLGMLRLRSFVYCLMKLPCVKVISKSTHPKDFGRKLFQQKFAITPFGVKLFTQIQKFYVLKTAKSCKFGTVNLIQIV